MHRLPLNALLALVAVAAVILVGASLALVDPGTARADGCGSAYSGGDGLTPSTPYLISTRADLVALAEDSSCDAGDYYLQTADIDLTGVAWQSIGRPAVGSGVFTGTYDGGGHRITGLRIDSVSASNVGLFGYVRGSQLSRLTIAGAVVDDGASGHAHIGVLAGLVEGTVITDVHVTDAQATLSGDDYDVGGLVGAAEESTITGSSATGTVVAGSPIGGLVGDACGTGISSSTSGVAVRSTSSWGTGGLVGRALPECLGPTALGVGIAPALAPVVGIFDAQATGAVLGGADVGGLVGNMSGVPIARSFATGAVEGNVSVGGLVGTAYPSVVGGPGAADAPPGVMTIADSYARGAVTGRVGVGGLVGSAGGTLLERTYATGRVTAESDVGGLVGSVGVGSIELPPSFWDVETTGQTVSVGGTGRTTAEMKAIATFSAAGWAIASNWVADPARTWGICPRANDGYPFLLREYTAATQPCTVPAAPAAPVPAATSAAAPKAKLAVTSTQRAGRSAVTRVQVSGPGTVTQVGKAVGSGVVACRSTPVVVRKAGTAVLTCELTAAALKRLRYGALRVRLVTRFTPTAGAPVTTVRVVRFARIAGVRPVTG